jgi:pyruvate kinase
MPSTPVTTVEVGGKLSNRKGVSVPDTEIPVGALTAEGPQGSGRGAEGVDWVALSFIQRPDDLAEVRKIARGKAGSRQDREAAGHRAA